MHHQEDIARLEKEWQTSERWKGIKRPYKAEDVLKLRGTILIEYTLAKLGAERFWKLLHTEPYIKALGALTGNQALQQVQAGLKAIYLSGWQVAGDANTAEQMYPDQSLYPVDSVPTVIRKINNAFLRADQIDHLEGQQGTHWFAPILADAEAGFGGPLNTYEIMKAMVEAGAAGVHLEDQISSLKKCGHMGGKVLEPYHIFVEKLIAARLAFDVLGVPTILVARTDAESAAMIRSDIDDLDRHFITGEKTADGYYRVKSGVNFAIARALAYAPYADMLWCETSNPNLEEAKKFASAIHAQFPGKLLAYNCSPSFNWKKYLNEKDLGHFQDSLGEMGYKFQFVTLAGFHTLNTSMFDLAYNYNKKGMLAYSQLQEKEFELEKSAGYKAVKHQRFVGVGYFDQLQMVISSGKASTTALEGSTEKKQFE